mgnify:CR=1 FL=1
MVAEEALKLTEDSATDVSGIESAMAGVDQSIGQWSTVVTDLSGKMVDKSATTALCKDQVAETAANTSTLGSTMIAAGTETQAQLPRILDLVDHIRNIKTNIALCHEVLRQMDGHEAKGSAIYPTEGLRKRVGLKGIFSACSTISR